MKAKYGLKALIALARQGEQPLRASSLSKREGIPPKFAEIILFELTRAGLLNSQKGPGGGYFLARDPRLMSLGPLMRALDGPLAPVPCVSETAYQRCEDCVDEETCRVRKLMQQVRDASAQVLDSMTLADLAGLERIEVEEERATGVPATNGTARLLEGMGKSTRMIMHKTSPLNGGPPPDELVRHQITPQSLFFIRNHGTIPRIEADSYRLEVDGLVDEPLRISLRELRRQFEEVTVEAALMCAGNRRQEFDDIRPIRGEVPWGTEAVSNGTWTGVRLSDVLERAGLKSGARHVEFTGLDEVTRDGKTFGFGGSIPIHKARAEEVLLAYEMNGQPLAPTHGAPLRVVVPGFIGARSVKWLARIHAQREPSLNYFQAVAYKMFPPHVRPENVDYAHGQMLGELYTTAAACSPARRAMPLRGGEMELRGYALGGDGRKVTRVEISVDDGQSWQEAKVTPGASPWAWYLWECRAVLPDEVSRVWVRAWDDHEVQPPFAADLWNFKGYMNNSWYCIRNSG